MSNAFWRKLSHTFGLIAVGVLFGLAVFAANIEIKDLDLWLHLKTGEYVVQHGYVPDVDVLSCSIKGKPWNNHEWLFQVVLYLVFHNWGADGLIFMQVLIVTFTLLVLLLLGYQKEKQFGSIFILLLVMLVYQSRFTMRPDILSLLFFALYIYILALHTGSKWAVYTLFLVQVLWTNVHGFFFFGPLLVLIGMGSEFLKRHVRLPWQWNEVGRLTDAEYLQLKKILFFVILACLVNPQTFKGAWYPIGVLFQISGKSRIFFEYIQELQPPIKWGTIFSTSGYIYYKLLILISFSSFVLNRRKIDIGDFSVWLLFLLFSLVALRNIVFFAFAAYLVCMANFVNLSMNDIVPVRFSHKKFQHISVSFLKVFLVLWMLQYGQTMTGQAYFDFDKYEMKSEFGGITQRNYPSKAADFLVENQIKGNFFNDFNSGAYLIGRCYPNIRVFMDGRTEVYGPDFFEKYRRVWSDGDTELFDESVEKFNVTGAFLNSTRAAIPKGILSHIYESKDWVLVYFDYDAVIFLKDIPRNKKWIKEFRLDLSKWESKGLDLQRLGSMRVTPYQHINRAFTLETLGFDDAALDEARHALKVSPGYIEPYKLIGKIYGKEEEYQKAFENFRIATMAAPYDSKNRLNLGLAYEKLEDFEGAKKQYEFIIKRHPKDPKGHFSLAKALAGNKEYQEALKVLKTVYPLARDGASDFIKIGDLIYEAEEFKLAKEVYEMALTKKKTAKTYHKIGLCYKAGGFKDKAKEMFNKGMALDPDDDELKKDLKNLGK